MKQQTVVTVERERERERERATLYRINENKNFAKLVIKNIASIFSGIKYIKRMDYFIKNSLSFFVL